MKSTDPTNKTTSETCNALLRGELSATSWLLTGIELICALHYDSSGMN